MDGMITPLRGRVIVRILDDITSDVLVIPQSTKRVDGPSLGRGVIVAHGPPALSKRGVEVPQEFAVGDTVYHLGQHKSRELEWNGEKCRVCAQEEVVAVVES